MGTCRQGRPGQKASLRCRPQHVQQAVGWHSVLCHGERILSHGSVGAHCALTYCSAAVVQYLHSITPELFSPGVASTLSINFVALLWQLVGKLGTGRRGHRGSVSVSGIIACIMGTWLAQRAWAQCLHTRVLTCTACAATARLCTIGPIRAAGRFFAQRVLAEDVFSRRSLGAQLAVGWHCAPAVQQLRSSIAPRVVPAKGSVSPTLSISLLVGAMLWWLVGHWTRVRHGHRPAWSQAILVTAGLVGHRGYVLTSGIITCATGSQLAKRGWAQPSYKGPYLHCSESLCAACFGLCH